MVTSLTNDHFYQGDLAYLREVEKRGRMDLLYEARLLISLQDFGVEPLHQALTSSFYELWLMDMKLSWVNICGYVYKKLRKVGDHLIDGDDIIDPVCNKFTWSFRYPATIFGSWQVPARDNPKELVYVNSGDILNNTGIVSAKERIMKHLIRHEIEEQLMFGGYRLHDPHRNEYPKLPQFSPPTYKVVL